MKPIIVYGIGWLLLFNLFDATWINIVSYLSSQVHTFEIMCYANGIAALLLFFYLKVTGSFAVSSYLKLHSIRVLFEFVGAFLYVYSLVYLPAAEVKALIFLTPIIASVNAVYFLGERSSTYKWCALGISFIGVIIVLQPGREVIHFAAFMVLAGALFLSGGLTILKLLSTKEDPRIVACHFMGLTSLVSLPFALAYGKIETLEAVVGITMIGICFLGLQVALGKACSMLPLVAVTPFMFVALIFVALIAYVAFGHVPSISTFIGAAVILGAATYTGYRESKEYG